MIQRTANTQFFEMTSQYLKQKFIYDVKPDLNEFPQIRDDSVPIDMNMVSPLSIDQPTIFDEKTDSRYVLGSSLLECSLERFYSMVSRAKTLNIHSIIIKDDENTLSNNPILEEGHKCYLESFIFLFQKNGLKSWLVSGE